MASFHGFKSRRSGKSHLRTASYHGCSRDPNAATGNIPDLHGFNLQDIPNLDIDKATSAVLPSEPVSPQILAPNLHEIQRLKLTLLQIQNMIHSNDELILNVRQNLLRRMVNYLNSVKTKDRASTEYQTMVEIKADVDDILKEQELLIVSLRQDKLKQLVDLKPKADAKQPHFQQGKLNRQLSRSVEMCRIIDAPTDSFESGQIKPLAPRLKGLQRSETTRAERSLYFGELAKKGGGNVVKRNKSLRAQQKRKSVEDIYAGISEVHLSRTSTMESGDTKPQQSFLKLDQSGQLVFDTKLKDAGLTSMDSPKSEIKKSDKNESTPSKDASAKRTDDTRMQNENSNILVSCSNTVAISQSEKVSKPKDHNANKIDDKKKTPISNITDTVSIQAKLPLTQTESNKPNFQRRPVLQETFDIASRNDVGKSKTQCTQTSPQATEVKGPLTIAAKSIPTMSKKTQTETEIIKTKSDCHNDENPMLSAEKDFVDVDDLIHFNQNHKPPPQPFVRGYNAVNSASFRQPSSPAFAAVENKISEVHGIKRDRITISGSKVQRRGKSENLSAQRLQTLVNQEGKADDGSGNKTTQNLPTHGYRKQKSYTATLNIDLKESDIIPTKPKFDKEVVSKGSEIQHDYANVQKTSRDHDPTNTKPSVSSMDGEVEFASNQMVIAQLKPDQITESANKTQVNKTMAPKDEINNELYVNSSMISHKTTQQSAEQYDNVTRASFETPESPIFETFKQFSEQLALMNVKTSSTSNKLDGYESESESSSDQEDLPPRGHVQNLKAKPRLIKKPPRKSTKLRRKMSQSLTDLTAPKPRQSPESKVCKDRARPTSFIHDESVYDVPKSIPVYENIGHIVPGSKTETPNQNQNGVKKPKAKPVRRMSKKATKVQSEVKDTNFSSRKINNPPDLIKQTDVNPRSLSNVKPDLTETASVTKNPTPANTKSNETTPKTMTSSRRPEMRKSASDDIIYEDEQKKLREDLRRLTELQDELVETNDSIKGMWRTIQEDMLNMIHQQVDSKTKRSTLPKAMTPNFGKKRKCVIM